MSDIDKAVRSHTNLNIFAAVAGMLECGCVYPLGSANKTAQRIIELCHKEQVKQLRIFDRAVAVSGFRKRKEAI